jgi:hypothetical protein
MPGSRTLMMVSFSLVTANLSKVHALFQLRLSFSWVPPLFFINHELDDLYIYLYAPAPISAFDQVSLYHVIEGQINLVTASLNHC